MALDGLAVHALVNELSESLSGGKVDKIFQPERDKIILNIRNSNKNFKLLISVNPQGARVNITENTYENPIVAPNFCMLLRKHLQPSRLVSVTQPEFERTVILTFECQTELFDIVEKKLIIEIMGHFSNIIFVDEKGLIIDALRQVDYTTSSKRQVLPALPYELPPKQEKEVFDGENIDIDFTLNVRADKYLTDKYLGFSPLISRETVYFATGQTDTRLSEFTQAQKEKFIFSLKMLNETLTQNKYSPCVIFDGKPIEFYFKTIGQYGSNSLVKTYETFSEAIEAFYIEKDEQEHVKRLSGDILKVITNAQTRIAKKIEAQRADIAECEKALKFKDMGDLITANIYLLKQGQEKASLMDYTKDPPQETVVELDKALTPARNAQRYYKKYKKAVTALEILNVQIPEGEKELIYLDSVFEELVRAKTSADVDEIRAELSESGYMKKSQSKKNPKKPKTYSPKIPSVVSADGFTIYIGKNNLQNDYLTLRMSDKRDIWFHTKEYPGSHVVVAANGEKVPDSTLNEAAEIAAKNSKAGTGGLVAVDYTEIKNVKKQPGGKPGMVVYTTYKTAYIKL
ncbi:MAG: fibronectin/fibrinogen-binding protein [Ruminococcaceae bacterium]|nr:fibronectin/fibrinogen-binding protein [Oscillospiraceae bacterium]